MTTFIYENPDRKGWWFVKTALDNGEVWITEIGPQASNLPRVGVKNLCLRIESALHHEHQTFGWAHLSDTLTGDDRWMMVDE